MILVQACPEVYKIRCRVRSAVRHQSHGRSRRRRVAALQSSSAGMRLDFSFGVWHACRAVLMRCLRAELRVSGGALRVLATRRARAQRERREPSWLRVRQDFIHNSRALRRVVAGLRAEMTTARDDHLHVPGEVCTQCTGQSALSLSCVYVHCPSTHCIGQSALSLSLRACRLPYVPSEVSAWIGLRREVSCDVFERAHALCSARIQHAECGES